MNSFGLMLNNFSRMALYTDPINASGFPEKWTMFFGAFPMTYAGLMGAFISKISKGRTIKELVCCCVLGISVGSWVLFAVDAGVAMNCELSGTVSLTRAVLEGYVYPAIYQVLETLPLGKMLCFVIVCIIIGFTAALDSASLALASITIRDETENGRGELKTRIFWCFTLPMLPLSMIFSGVSFEAMKELAILISMPLLIVEILLIIGFFRWTGKAS